MLMLTLSKTTRCRKMKMIQTSQTFQISDQPFSHRTQCLQMITTLEVQTTRFKMQRTTLECLLVSREMSSLQQLSQTLDREATTLTSTRITWQKTQRCRWQLTPLCNSSKSEPKIISRNRRIKISALLRIHHSQTLTMKTTLQTPNSESWTSFLEQSETTLTQHAQFALEYFIIIKH